MLYTSQAPFNSLFISLCGRQKNSFCPCSDQDAPYAPCSRHVRSDCRCSACISVRLENDQCHDVLHQETHSHTIQQDFKETIDHVDKRGLRYPCTKYTNGGIISTTECRPRSSSLLPCAGNVSLFVKCVMLRPVSDLESSGTYLFLKTSLQNLEK